MIARCEYRSRPDVCCAEKATRLRDTPRGSVRVCDTHARTLEDMRCRETVPPDREVLGRAMLAASVKEDNIGAD